MMMLMMVMVMMMMKSTIFIILIVNIIVQAMISCSICDSRRDTYHGECERFPPPPKLCLHNITSSYCYILRETYSNGKQSLFARGCLSEYKEEQCVEKYSGNMKKSSCIRTCDKDGCNAHGLKTRQSAANMNTLHYIALAFAFLVNVHNLVYV